MKIKLMILLAGMFFIPANAVLLTRGILTHQNQRSYQEDCYEARELMDPNNKKLGDFFGVYDGHGGDKASTLLARELHKKFGEQLYRGDENKPVYKEQDCFEFAFSDIEKQALASFNDGSTAVVGYIDNHYMLHAAWLGDSRLVVECNGQVGFATEDHKPNRFDEKRRIESEGGKVSTWGVPRVNGLAVSRSIGDRKLKKGVWSKCIISDPEYAQYQLTQNNEFMILASDGLWDVISNQEAITLVKERLDKGENVGDKNGTGLDEGARALVNEAIKRGSKDNITVIVVRIKWLQKSRYELEEWKPDLEPVPKLEQSL